MVEFTVEEKNKLVFSTIARLSTDATFARNGILYNLLSGELPSSDGENLFNTVQLLCEKYYIACDFSNKDMPIKITEIGIGEISKNNDLPLDEVSYLLIAKTYELYKRGNSNILLSFNSLQIGGILGISNFDLINAGVADLKNNGLIKVKLVTRFYSNYNITVEGIRKMEKSYSKEFVVNAPKGNRAIEMNVNNSQVNIAMDNATVKATQNINPNIQELNRLIEGLLKEIPENISGEIRTQIQESVDSMRLEFQNPKPKINMVKTLLSGLKGLVTTTGFISSVLTIEKFIEQMFK